MTDRRTHNSLNGPTVALYVRCGRQAAHAASDSQQSLQCRSNFNEVHTRTSDQRLLMTNSNAKPSWHSQAPRKSSDAASEPKG